MLLDMDRSATHEGTVFRGGTLVTEAGQTRADLLVKDGLFAGVGTVPDRGHVVDASGLFLMPGMVDTHVHLMDPGDTTREDFPTGTAAAAARGVTTVIEHTHSDPIRTLADLEEKRQHVATRSNVDFALAAHVWPEHIDQIHGLTESGIGFFKIFTCDTHGVPGLDSSTLARALAEIARVDARCLVHNEDQEITADAERRLRADGRVDPALLVEWRSRAAELVAVATTASLALETGARATFAHVSNPAILDVIEAFNALGSDVAAEACPQYLALEEDEVTEHGAFRKFTPPARLRGEEDRRAMWDAVRSGRFSHFSTDHAPSTKVQKLDGDIWDVPFGLPGLDTTLPFLLDSALGGEIELSDLVRLYATAPADRYRLNKGRIEVGVQADLVLVDPKGSWTVSEEDIISKAGWSPFTGSVFKGRVVATYLRGREIARDGRCHDLTSGSFVRPTQR